MKQHVWFEAELILNDGTPMTGDKITAVHEQLRKIILDAITGYPVQLARSKVALTQQTAF